jgi:transcriptional regulator with XRE-family HTH domain
MTAVRRLCAAAGVSLSWLATEAGVSLEALRKIADGRSQPTLATALRIAEALDVDVEDLAD